MTDIAHAGAPPIVRPKLDGGFGNMSTVIVFGGVIAAALLFVAYSLYVDVDDSGTQVTTFLPFILLFVALLIALGFEFVTSSISRRPTRVTPRTTNSPAPRCGSIGRAATRTPNARSSARNG
jgi:hypothetical protein